MTFFESIASCFNNYVNFSGRATRSEYWWFALFCLLLKASTLLAIYYFPEWAQLEIFTSLILLLPSYAVTARRFHDLDMTAWWILILLLPILGAFVFLYWMCKAGEPGANRFGPRWGW